MKECIEKGKQNNVIIKLAEQSLQTREKLLQSNKNNNLPKVDFLGGYNYIGVPIKINLQQVKDGIVEGSATQSAASANTVYQQITGNPLPQQVQNVIYQTSKDISAQFIPITIRQLQNKVTSWQEFSLVNRFIWAENSMPQKNFRDNRWKAEKRIWNLRKTLQLIIFH